MHLNPKGLVSSRTVLDLDEEDVTLKNADIFGSVLSREEEDGCADGWRCC